MSSSNKPKALLEIQKILSIAEEKTFAPEEHIFKEGDEDRNFYIILRGVVEIAKKTTEGTDKVIAHLNAGEFLGEGVLSGNIIKPASAKAVEETTVMFIHYEDIEKMINQDSRTFVDFLLMVLEAVNSRLANSNTKIMALYEISQLLNMYRDDLSSLASGLINKLMAITESKGGIVLLKNPFAEKFRVIYSTDEDLGFDDLKDVEMDGPQIKSDEKHHYIITGLKKLGLLALRRPIDFAVYSDDQLRLLALIADQTASVIKEASEKASEKARNILERKRFDL